MTNKPAGQQIFGIKRKVLEHPATARPVARKAAPTEAELVALFGEQNEQLLKRLATLEARTNGTPRIATMAAALREQTKSTHDIVSLATKAIRDLTIDRIVGIAVRKELPATAALEPTTTIAGIRVKAPAERRQAEPAATTVIAGIRVKALQQPRPAPTARFLGIPVRAGAADVRRAGKDMPAGVSMSDIPGSLVDQAASALLEDTRQAAGCSPELFDALIKKLGRDQTYAILSAAAPKASSKAAGDKRPLIK